MAKTIAYRVDHHVGVSTEMLLCPTCFQAAWTDLPVEDITEFTTSDVEEAVYNGAVDECESCGETLLKHDPAWDTSDDAHERAAARARSNDFDETNGKDWT